MKTVKFKTTINCGSCIKSVTPFLNELINVETWKVDVEDPDKILKIEIDDNDSDVIIQAVKKAGFEIEEV